MSRRIILTFILITATLTLFSQETNSLHFGFTTGLHATTQSFDSDLAERTSSQPSYSATINVFYDINSRVQFYGGIGIETINYNTIDYTPTFPADFIDAATGIDIRRTFLQNSIEGIYLMVPAMIRYKLNSGKSNHFYLAGGFRFKQLLDDDAEFLILSPDQELDNTLLSMSNNLIDLSSSIGYEFTLSKIKLFTELNGYYTLNQITTDEGNLSESSRYLAAGFNIGIRF